MLSLAIDHYDRCESLAVSASHPFSHLFAQKEIDRITSIHDLQRVVEKIVAGKEKSTLARTTLEAFSPGEQDLFQELIGIQTTFADYWQFEAFHAGAFFEGACRAIQTFRLIENYFAGPRPRILLLGDDSAHLSTLLSVTDHRYALVEHRQPEYLLQNHVIHFEHLIRLLKRMQTSKETYGDALDSLYFGTFEGISEGHIGDAHSILCSRLRQSPIRSLHIPWWLIDSTSSAERGAYDLTVVSESLLSDKSERFPKLLQWALDQRARDPFEPTVIILDGWRNLSDSEKERVRSAFSPYELHALDTESISGIFLASTALRVEGFEAIREEYRSRKLPREKDRRIPGTQLDTFETFCVESHRNTRCSQLHPFVALEQAIRTYAWE